jgi:AraC-like DNA-binding protein
MAAVARLSPYHFARQFKTATGLPPHQYVIARRVERAKQLLHVRQEAHDSNGFRVTDRPQTRPPSSAGDVPLRRSHTGLSGW